MAEHAAGRHRAPGRFNPLTELTGIAAQCAQPAVKTSAVLAASGGLVAAFAIPAQAASAAEKPSTGTTTAAAVPAAVQAPAAAAPTQTAFGVIGFSATAKPKPKPKPARPRPRRRPRAHRAGSQPLRRAGTADLDQARHRRHPGHRRPVRGHHVQVRRHQPVDRLRLLGLHPVRLPSGRDQPPAHCGGAAPVRHPVSSPQPGDLVFFGSPAYHVGIYAGNGKMWDSPHSGEAVALRDIWTSAVTYGRP